MSEIVKPGGGSKAFKAASQVEHEVAATNGSTAIETKSATPKGLFWFWNMVKTLPQTFAETLTLSKAPVISPFAGVGDRIIITDPAGAVKTGVETSRLALTADLGGILFVAKSGNDTGLYGGMRGRIDRPFLTVQAAINAAQSGDIIEVYAGTYAENITNGTKKIRIRLFNAVITASSGRTVDSTVNTFNVNDAGLEIEGFGTSKIVNTGVGALDTAIFGASLKLRNMQFENAGPYFFYVNASILDNCRFTAPGDCLRMDGRARLNNSACISTGSTAGKFALMVWNCQDAIITNNRLKGQIGAYLNEGLNSDNFEFYENTFQHLQAGETAIKLYSGTFTYRGRFVSNKCTGTLLPAVVASAADLNLNNYENVPNLRLF